MNASVGQWLGDLNDSILPSQYNDLIRRRSRVLRVSEASMRRDRISRRVKSPRLAA